MYDAVAIYRYLSSKHIVDNIQIKRVIIIIYNIYNKSVVLIITILDKIYVHFNAIHNIY
jgi:hypothetical protein